MSIHVGIVTHQRALESGKAEHFKQTLESFLADQQLETASFKSWVKSNRRNGFDFYILDQASNPIFSSSSYSPPVGPHIFNEEFNRFESTISFELNEVIRVLIEFDQPPTPISKYPWELTAQDIEKAGYLAFSLVFLFANLSLVFALILFRWIGYRVVNQRAKQVNEVFDAMKKGEPGQKIESIGITEVDRLIENFNLLMQQTEDKISELEATRSSLNQKVYELSHDFKTPLTSINQIAQNTKNYFDQLSQEDIQKNMGIVLAEVSFISRMVENMLFLTQMSHESTDQIRERLCLSDILNREIDNFHSNQKALSTSITEQIYIKGNDLYVSRLVKNLLDNAFKYSDESVAVKLERDKSECILTIENDGQSIQNKRSFGLHKLNRKISSLNGIHISMGLGSVIIRKIVNMLEGKLAISDGAVSGTIIKISLQCD